MDPIDIAQESSFISENEKRHYLSIIRTFKAYSEITQRILDSRKQSLSKVSEDDLVLLKNYEQHISKLRKLVNLNQAFLDEVIESSDQIFTNVHSSFYNHNKSDKLNALSSNVDSANYDKLKTTLKQIVRDWSIVGSEERSQCYQPIINAINSYFTGVQRSDICVLVPGAGLGRLAFDLAVDGYICQGNEVSLFMLFTSNYLINRGIEANTMCIYPWITNFSNNLTYDDQCSSVYIPDINTYSFDSLKFTMVAGNFLQVYRSKDTWDCVTTCFFLDTANNIVEYVRRIFLILKPGGLWVNLGPLLYHFSDMSKEISIELPYEDVKEIIISIGFKIKEEELNVKTTYLRNPNSMLTYDYHSVFFTAVKPNDVSS